VDIVIESKDRSLGGDAAGGTTREAPAQVGRSSA
jgi:hypothetical protein